MSTPGVMTREEYREWCRSGAIPEHLRGAKPAPAVTNIEPVDDSTAGETEIQAAIVRELRALGFVAFHVPNGGKRRRIEAAILKGIGVLPGVADVGVLLLGGRIAWLEAKTSTGTPRPSQVKFARWCKRLGHEYHVVRSWAEVAPIAAAWQRYDVGEAIA